MAKVINYFKDFYDLLIEEITGEQELTLVHFENEGFALTLANVITENHFISINHIAPNFIQKIINNGAKDYTELHSKEKIILIIEKNYKGQENEVKKVITQVQTLGHEIIALVCHRDFKIEYLLNDLNIIYRTGKYVNYSVSEKFPLFQLIKEDGPFKEEEKDSKLG